MDKPIQALVLNRIRYGETSLILKLFTEKYGLISGMMKGALNAKKWAPESGMIIQTLPIRRREEGMFTLSATEYEYQYSFSNSLIKSAVRDTALELSLAVLHEENPHAELYELFGKFLHHLESCSESSALFSLWLFILRFGDALGVSVERSGCVICGEPFRDGGELLPEQGGFACGSCRPKKSPLFSAEIISLLTHGKPSPDDLIPRLTPRERYGVTLLLTENLRSHFSFHRDIHSLEFLKEIV